MDGKRVYAWTCVGYTGVTVMPATSRGMAVLESHFSHLFDKPITVDRYAAYNLFGTRQRCWSHILREAEYAINDPLTRLLYEQMYCKARAIQNRHTRVSDESVILLVERTRSIVAEYRVAGISFGTKLENAAENLYTFVRYSGMHPTNNESERMLRKVVIHRKIRQKFVNVEGMRRFGIRMSCIMTWRRRGASVYDMMLEVLGAT